MNHKDEFVVFGAFDITAEPNKQLIFAKSWQYKKDGKKSAGYQQSLNHIKLIESGYTLKVFSMTHAEGNPETGTAKIKSFSTDLYEKKLWSSKGVWFAVPVSASPHFAEEIPTPEQLPLFEGAKTSVVINAYERNPKARLACLDFHGFKCKICKFDFQEVYGSLGKEYIHVHHLTPLSEIKGEYEVNPEKDLIPVCPNCHSMLHKKSPALKPAELEAILMAQVSQ